ncbi:MAG: helix-turn-helix transcriptional regulator [Chloroflexi bacterium]|nr:helix-turn-helix transcriptional regulator [Chloroflexota bacterium]
MVIHELVQATLQQRRIDTDRHVVEHEARATSEAEGDVRLLTSAARVLATVADQPAVTMREIARRCGQTERAIWQQLGQLERAGFLKRKREGRRNRYEVDQSAVARQLLVESSALLGSG